MISLRVVPHGWVAVAPENYDVYVKLGAPLVGVGLNFYAPGWAVRLVHDWPRAGFALENFREPHLLGRVVRALALDGFKFESPDEGVEAVLSSIDLGGFDAVFDLLVVEEP